MDARRWERIKQAFSAVIAHGPVGAAEALIKECNGDDELAREVRPLIDEHFRRLETDRNLGPADLPEPAIPDVVAGRFRVVARLGSGGFGDVYRVIDEAMGGEQLALKILRSSDPVALHYFKREFRSLAGIYHRNIVALHELIAHENCWMASMEFVDGVDLLHFLKDRPAQDRDTALRSCLLQLAEGLMALHQRNLLHRDVKPSNVLVTGAGRLVLLDFGLVRAFGDDAPSGDATPPTVTFAGTPDYMSPEQAAGDPAGEPTDWYAVGVMLYQALTGRRPFQCNRFEVLRRKQIERPIAPADLVPGVPEDLNDLCQSLLECDPMKRASYADVIRLVDRADHVQVPEPASPLFVGRGEPLGWLADAYSEAQDRPVVVHLTGTSGIGKTVLLREFSRRLVKEPGTLLFAGRCYEGESVPYQALDDLVDHIAQHFRRLPMHRVEPLLPRNFAVLVKMFPVLAPFLTGDTRPATNLNSVELRTRALSALREMLGRFSEHHRLVLVIDDLQWGDADGCAALSDLLSSADWPTVLVVFAYRSEDIEASAPLKALRDTSGQPASRKTIFIDLDQLESDEASELVRRLLAQPADETAVQRITEQSGGNPFLIQEIARWVNARGLGSVLGQPLSFADVVRPRVNELSPESRQFLELVAVAGQPTELSILQVAGRLTNVLSAREELAATRFVRSRTVRYREEVEVYHDRIRATIVAGMDPAALVLRHRELARAMEAAGGHDPERIAMHFEQARDPHSCARYALLAARRAVQVLAFNKASRFFEMALATGTLEIDERRTAHRECADALANAGRGPRAAEHYLAACEGAKIDEQLEWNLRAAEQLLYSGHVDRGLAIFKTVLDQVGVRLPDPAARVPLDLLFRRAQLRVRGLGWRERPASEVQRKALLQVDTCASVATGLALIDIARGAALQTTSLLLALRAGEPSRIARALAMEAGYRSTAGVKAERPAKELLATSKELSDRTGDPRAIGLTAVMAAGCAWNAGRWHECYKLARAAREALHQRYERLTWERDTASIFEVDGLRWMGRWSLMKAILPELVEDARLRGDLYAESILQMHGGSCAEIANDEPLHARAGLALLERWSNTGFHVEHLIEMHNQAEIELYLGNGHEALALILKRWPALRDSLLLRVQTFNIQIRSLRARAALGAALQEDPGARRDELLRLAERESRAIKREEAGWGCALGELIQGGIEALSGRREGAMVTFRRADKLSASAGMLMHSAAARRALGKLIGGDVGTQLVAAADADVLAEGVSNPERLATVIAPGVN